MKYHIGINLPYTVCQLNEVVLSGIDCRFALHDALLEAGLTQSAAWVREEHHNFLTILKCPTCGAIYKLLAGEIVEIGYCHPSLIKELNLMTIVDIVYDFAPLVVPR